MSQVTRAAPHAPPADRAVARRRSTVTTVVAWFPALLGAAFLFQSIRAGLPAFSAGRAVAAVLITQLVPGVLLWRCVRPLRGWWLEDVAMGFALGTVLAVAAQTLAGVTRVAAFSGLLGVVVAAILVVVPATRRRIARAETAPLPLWWAPAVSLTALVGVQQLQSYYRLVPLTWPAGFRAPHVDTYFHLSIAAELVHRGPERFPWVASEPLAYHWFSHAWIAQVSVASETGLDEVLVRFAPALMPLVMAFAVATAAVRLCHRPIAGPVAALLTLAGSDLNVVGNPTPGYPISPLSPSLALAAPATIGVVVVIALHWRRELRRGGLLLVPVLTFVATGMKGSAAPLLVAGLFLAVVAMAMANRSLLKPVLVDFGLVLGAMALDVVVVFRGSDAGLHIEPWAAIRETPAARWLGGVHDARTFAFVAGITLVAVLARGVGLLGVLGSRAGRRDPLTWLLTGAGLAGAGAVLVFAHPGQSQWYFLRTADPLLALGSAVGLAALADRFPGGIRRPALVGLVAGPTLALLPSALFGPLTPRGGLPRATTMLAAALAVLALAALAAAVAVRGRPLRAVGAVLIGTVLVAGIIQVARYQLTTRPTPYAGSVPASAPLAVSRDQVNAARWIRDHSGVDDVVMTNRHCISPTVPRHCDSRRFVVAAFSERQMLLEGWSGSARATAIAPRGRESIVLNYWRPDVLRLNDGFIEHPDAAAARRLRALGVRWVFVDHTRPYAATLAPFAIPRFHNAGVDVYELPPQAG
ncbi:MAG: hypothetical protein ABJC62_11750 [Frankiaceae bacterium]